MDITNDPQGHLKFEVGGCDLGVAGTMEGKWREKILFRVLALPGPVAPSLWASVSLPLVFRENSLTCQLLLHNPCPGSVSPACPYSFVSVGVGPHACPPSAFRLGSHFSSCWCCLYRDKLAPKALGRSVAG